MKDEGWIYFNKIKVDLSSLIKFWVDISIFHCQRIKGTSTFGQNGPESHRRGDESIFHRAPKVELLDAVRFIDELSIVPVINDWIIYI